LYTYRRPDNILWFQRIRQRMGFAERRAEGIWAGRFGRQNILVIQVNAEIAPKAN